MDKTAPPGVLRVRPNMPHYGVMPEQVDGMLEWAWVEREMEAARNYWLCTANADGSPHAAPVWGIWFDGAFIFGTDKQSRKAANIARGSRGLIHLESSDDTVIFHGKLVEARIAAAQKERMTQAYIDKYELDPQPDETGSQFYRLLPRKVMAWLEKDYPASATYWLFDED